MQLDKASAVSGYRRSHRITIDNPDGGVPSLAFALQWVVTTDGTPVYLDGGSKSITLADPSRPLTIVNPVDDSVLMTVDDAFVQAVLYSLYQRDVAGQEVTA